MDYNRPIAVRLTEAQHHQIENLQNAGFGNQTDIIRLAIDRMHQTEFRHKEKMMTFEELLTQEYENVELRYCGSVFGDEDDDPWQGTGKSIWLDLLQMFSEDDLNKDPVLASHPTYSNAMKGWYIQSGDIWFKGAIVEECVFEMIGD
jgi:Arc/MetJ-type ribon-helix-helix transcriptional regulator